MTQATRDKAFRKAQAARGLVKVTIWVPASEAESFRKRAAWSRDCMALRK